MIHQQLMVMTKDFKKPWDDSSVPNRKRKRLLAYIIEEATVIKLPMEGITKIHVRFKGGKTETLTTLNPKSSAQHVRTAPTVVEFVDKLLDQYIYYEIADILNKRACVLADRLDPNAATLLLPPCASPSQNEKWLNGVPDASTGTLARLRWIPLAIQAAQVELPSSFSRTYLCRTCEMSLTNKRIPGLDGLRAISIILVLGGHLAGTRNCYSAALYGKFGDLANLGVRVFFVISGYLITTLLLKEYAKTQTVSLKNFYIRRTLRIFPAFYTFLLAMTFVQAWGLISLKSGDLLHAFTYTTNYHYDSSWWIGHTWSLSVEEQFYLLWPALLLLLGIRRGLFAAGALVFMAPVVRIAVWYLWPAQRAGIGWSFPTIADTIATGCLLAGTRGRVA